MYLVYIYKRFILNVFLTFFLTFLTFIYVVIKVKISSWTFVWEVQGAVHVRKDLLKIC